MTSAAIENAKFGDMLRRWRRARGLSQLDLALTCRVSQRHLSFLESGRANPSRGMIMHLASVLAVPLNDQNALLLAAGFAPAYRAREPSEPDMSMINEALDRVLGQQEPYPALVVDRLYNLLQANDAAQRLLDFLLDAGTEAGQSPGTPPNLAAMLLAPEGLRPVIANWEETAIWLLRRLRAEALMEGTVEETEALLQTLAGLPDVRRLMSGARDGLDLPPTLVTKFARGDVRLALFSMIATLGTPLDANLQNLRVEYFFPADDRTRDWFRLAARSTTALKEKP